MYKLLVILRDAYLFFCFRCFSLVLTRLVSSTLAGYFANYARSVECDNHMDYLGNVLIGI